MDVSERLKLDVYTVTAMILEWEFEDPVPSVEIFDHYVPRTDEMKFLFLYDGQILGEIQLSALSNHRTELKAVLRQIVDRMRQLKSKGSPNPYPWLEKP